MIKPRQESNPGRLANWGRGRMADFYLRPPTLTASNFAALWPTDPILIAMKVLNPFERYTKVQQPSYVFRINYARSKWPHFHRACLVTVRKRMSIAVIKSKYQIVKTVTFKYTFACVSLSSIVILHIQSSLDYYTPLLHKPYWNEVTLNGDKIH